MNRLSAESASLAAPLSPRSPEERALLAAIDAVASEFARLVFEDVEKHFSHRARRYERDYSFLRWQAAPHEARKLNLDVFPGFIKVLALYPLHGMLSPQGELDRQAQCILTQVYMHVTLRLCKALDQQSWSRDTLVMPLARGHSAWSMEADVCFLGVTVIRERFARRCKLRQCK